MRVLIADDDAVSRRLLEALLTRWGYDVVVTTDGSEALQALQQPDSPQLAILDWTMPEVDGVEVSRRVRDARESQALYIILLTASYGKENIVVGLQAGVDDYVTKPFEPGELRARIQVGERILSLQSALADRVMELEQALSNNRRLQGLLPICASCNRIRDDTGYWNRLELYIRDRSEASFSHSMCPACMRRLHPDEYSAMFPVETGAKTQ